MEIQLANCNNILNGSITIIENRLNVKYAINGTGKSTIAKAIVDTLSGNSDSLKELTPYSAVGTDNPELFPKVTGLPDNMRVTIFDENYVNQYVFLEDDLVKNSFDIFVKTDNYETQLSQINELVSNIKNIFQDNPELESLITDMNEFISSFGKAKNGISASGSLVKGFGSGNVIQHIPEGLEDYSAFLNDSSNSKWLKWQSDGRNYMELGSNCPFCAGDLEPQKEKIEKIHTEYDSKTIEHLSKILELFERLGKYFSKETNTRIRDITANVQGLSKEQKNYLVEIKGNVEVFIEKLTALKHIGFDSLKIVDKLTVEIDKYKIDMSYLPHLNTEFTIQKVSIINNSIDELKTVVGQLQGAVNKQKKEIEQTIKRYDTEINEFLLMAGYTYKVSIEEDENHTYKMKLKFGADNTITSVKTHLSYGERNAFALVMFMYNSIYNKADFIILDDPISSFDKNKKFAILNMLFVRGNSFRGKTSLLLTHDFEPVIDTIYNHPSYFEGMPQAAFLENIDGQLQEKEIEKEDILSSVQVAKENISLLDNPVCKLIYMRRLSEIEEGKSNAWHLLSNIFHKRPNPLIAGEAMTDDAIIDATTNIRKYIPDFDYAEYLSYVTDTKEVLSLYHLVQSNYEKLQIYRILFEASDEDRVIRKFLNETYHIENDYLFQLNPIRFNTIPNYIVNECNSSVLELERGAQ